MGSRMNSQGVMICSGSFNVQHVFRWVFEEKEWERWMKAKWWVVEIFNGSYEG